MTPSATPHYLAIGHVCADLQPDGSTRLGGSAFFASTAAQRVGVRTAVATACAPDLDLAPMAPIDVARQPAPHSTVFENRYGPHGRTQFLHAQAAPIALAAIPAAWQRTPIVHLAPIIMHDVPLDALHHFPHAIVGVTPQGWLRTVGDGNIVGLEPPRILDLPWQRSHVAVLSEEDVERDEELIRQLAQRLDLLVLTRAERGATVWQHGEPTDITALPATVVDPTGAGDVFAAAVLIALHEGQPPLQAAYWARAAAAFAIEGPGVTTLPTRQQIVQRMQL